jgi:isoquinoline 1-oxidoreductase alpha subunit
MGTHRNPPCALKRNWLQAAQALRINPDTRLKCAFSAQYRATIRAHFCPGANAAPAVTLTPTKEKYMAKLNINGKVREFEAEPDTPLLWVLREQLSLTGTKYGCGIAQCGACTVHIDGQPVRSCSRPVSSVSGKEKIVTIEGLSKNGSHPVQKAWVKLDVPQCGFCQSGMIMAVSALLKTKPNPSDADIDAAVTNICRCGTYNRVRAAIKVVAQGGNTKSAKLAIAHTDGSTT